MNNDYIVTTGYYSPPDNKFIEDFFHIWYDNIIKYSSPKRIIVVNAGCKRPEGAKGEWLDGYNFGYVPVMDKERNCPKFCGWSIGFMVGMMIAFHNNCDFIYREQDTLAFGKYIDAIYNMVNKKGKKILVGEDCAHAYKIDNGFTFLKHDIILDFLKEWLTIDRKDAGPGRLRPEQKFTTVFKKFTKVQGFLPFGYGTFNRPINYEDETFYFHPNNKKALAICLEEVRKRKLV